MFLQKIIEILLKNDGFLLEIRTWDGLCEPSVKFAAVLLVHVFLTVDAAHAIT